MQKNQLYYGPIRGSSVKSSSSEHTNITATKKATMISKKGAVYRAASQKKVENVQRSFEKARRGAGLFGK
jgi:hypothetical protein